MIRIVRTSGSTALVIVFSGGVWLQPNLLVFDAVAIADDFQTDGLIADVLGFYEQLNKTIRETVQSELTLNVMYTDEPGDQTRPYVRCNVEIDEDLQTVLVAPGHKATGKVSFEIFIDDLIGDKAALEMLDELYTVFRRLTVDGVRFQPPRMRGNRNALIPFSCRV